MHYVLDRPHLNDGARVVRVKPRYNAEVNQWWLCDAGRYGMGWIDEGRLEKLRGPSENGVELTWELALSSIAAAQAEKNLGVIASAQLTNEELFLIKQVFKGAKISALAPEEPGSSDDFLIKADKNPNTQGATLLGLAGKKSPKVKTLVDNALAGKLDALWVFGHDLVALFGEDKVRILAEQLDLFVYCGTNNNRTAELAHWVLPGAAYVEKDGTFVNCHGRVQRIFRAFPPREGSREEWRILLELAAALGQELDFRGPEQIFAGLAGKVKAFKGLSYETIGETGVMAAS